MIPALPSHAPARRLPLASDDSGTTLLEMAVAIPVLLAIGLGVFEFGNLFYKYHMMLNAVRDAARYASGLVGSVCTDTTIQNRIKQIAQRNGVSNGIWTTGTVITVSCAPYDNKSAGYPYRGGDTLYAVTVAASVPYKSLGLLGYFGLTSPTLTVSHQERLIGLR